MSCVTRSAQGLALQRKGINWKHPGRGTEYSVRITLTFDDMERRNTGLDKDNNAIHLPHGIGPADL